MQAIRQRLCSSTAHVVTRFDAPVDAPVEHKSRPLAGNPGGFGVTRVQRHLWSNRTMFGSIERLKHVIKFGEDDIRREVLARVPKIKEPRGLDLSARA